jgi:glycosyltransferase involved in cell wall biosynthesis
MATLIIPAHNEASVIERCLDSLIQQKNVTRIIVACNGCTDNTAEIVNNNYGHLPHLICLDIKKPSKTHALNEAEKHIIDFPVFYIDADTALSIDAIPTITQQMQDKPLHLTAPTPIINTEQSSWLVKQYYKIWQSLPYIEAGVIATCSFIVSQQGRQRFDKFPDVINDDGYIRCQFKADEISNIAGSEIYIQAPKDIFSLIKIKTRARLGNMQLNTLNLCTHPAKKAYASSMKSKLFSKDAISAVIYYCIAIIIRIRANKQFSRINQYTWEKDNSSRRP